MLLTFMTRVALVIWMSPLTTSTDRSPVMPLTLTSPETFETVTRVPAGAVIT